MTPPVLSSAKFFRVGNFQHTRSLHFFHCIDIATHRFIRVQLLVPYLQSLMTIGEMENLKLVSLLLCRPCGELQNWSFVELLHWVGSTVAYIEWPIKLALSMPFWSRKFSTSFAITE